MMTDTRTSQWGPFLTLVFLFLVVGFLTTVNIQLQGPLKETFLDEAGRLKNTFATLITFSWFLAYPLCGKTGAHWISRYGYKVTLIRSLYLMMAGLSLFFISSWFTSRFSGIDMEIGSVIIPWGFVIFLLGSFTVGASATILQVVINPYLTACFVRGTQPVQRLAIGGSANSIGATAAPFFVAEIIFEGLGPADIRANQLMIPFAVLAGVIGLVALVLYRADMPDIQETKAGSGERLERSIWSFRRVSLGVAAIFFYVGAEVCVGAHINIYAQSTGHENPALLATVYWGLMLAGRLVGSSLRRVSPRVQLVFTTSCATVLLLLAMITGNPWFLAFVGLFHSIMWGTIYTLSIAGLGKYTALASGVFMIGVLGGAVLPLVQAAVSDGLGGWHHSWWLVVAGELFMLYYALAGSRFRQSETRFYIL